MIHESDVALELNWKSVEFLISFGLKYVSLSSLNSLSKILLKLFTKISNSESNGIIFTTKVDAGSQ